MAFLDDIGDYLEANAIGTLATDLFLAELPDTPDACIAVYEYAGNPPSKMGDNRQPGLQVRSRAQSYATARANIEAVYTLLSAIGDEFQDTAPDGVEINGTLYLHFETTQEPVPLGPDERGREEIALNFIVTF